MVDLEAQAERQRRRAPEPFEDVEPLPIPKPSRYVYVRRRQPTDWSILPFSFWVTVVILIVLAIYVNPWILWIGLPVYGLYKAFSHKPA